VLVLALLWAAVRKFRVSQRAGESTVGGDECRSNDNGESGRETRCPDGPLVLSLLLRRRRRTPAGDLNFEPLLRDDQRSVEGDRRHRPWRCGVAGV
jgi:hypothetical protein